MKRRTFGLLASTSLMALKFGNAGAQSTKDASLLKTTLTPMGAERAGNAAGTIPAWDGGYTTIPAGWQEGDYMPDFFAEEQPLTTIDASNMAQHADKLSDGVMALMTQYGFSIKVYPTHRTASAPQWVYDNIASNLNTATLNPAGGRLGFLNAYGGIPFPMPDIDDPLAAGAQIVWNHNTRWSGYTSQTVINAVAVNNGIPTLVAVSPVYFDYPYYHRNGSLATFGGLEDRLLVSFTGPPNLVGEEIMSYSSTNPYSRPNRDWELLNGQGRVRMAPELTFDTPDPFTDGIAIFDENVVAFQGSLEKYDWKYLGKQEMYIAYNNNGLILEPYQTALLTHFVDPKLVRWELHRVWVVEATLHPGERNVMARRKFYVDEDTWQIALAQTYDASNNLYHVQVCYSFCRPEVPGVVNPENSSIHDLRTGNYTTPNNWWNERAHPTVRFSNNFPESLFDPTSMAASAQY